MTCLSWININAWGWKQLFASSFGSHTNKHHIRVSEAGIDLNLVLGPTVSSKEWHYFPDSKY